MRIPPPAPPLTPAQSPRGCPRRKRDAVTTPSSPVLHARRRITPLIPQGYHRATPDFIFAEDFTAAQRRYHCAAGVRGPHKTCFAGERGSQERRTGGQPSQSPAVTALPKGEPSLKTSRPQAHHARSALHGAKHRITAAQRRDHCAAGASPAAQWRRHAAGSPGSGATEAVEFEGAPIKLVLWGMQRPLPRSGLERGVGKYGPIFETIGNNANENYSAE